MVALRLWDKRVLLRPIPARSLWLREVVGLVFHRRAWSLLWRIDDFEVWFHVVVLWIGGSTLGYWWWWRRSFKDDDERRKYDTLMVGSCGLWSSVVCLRYVYKMSFFCEIRVVGVVVLSFWRKFVWCSWLLMEDGYGFVIGDNLFFSQEENISLILHRRTKYLILLY